MWYVFCLDSFLLLLCLGVMQQGMMPQDFGGEVSFNAFPVAQTDTGARKLS